VLSLVRMTVPVFGRRTVAIWLPGVSATMVVIYSKLEAAADPVDRAVRLSIAGNLLPDSFAPLARHRTRRGMNGQCSAWWNAVEGLPAVHP
jgi:hypothetical protein